MAKKPFTEVREAINKVLDQHASIAVLTGRQTGNVMSFKYFTKECVPGLFHQMLTAEERIGISNYEVAMQLTAIAPTMSEAEDLLNTAVDLLTTTNFTTAGYDMAVVNVLHRDVGEVDFSRATDQTDDTERADADLVLWITI